MSNMPTYGASVPVLNLEVRATGLLRDCRIAGMRECKSAVALPE